MNTLSSRVIIKFNDLWDNTNLKSIDSIWKRMNKDGYKISNYQVRHLVHEKRREFIVDRDEESEYDSDDEYTDDEYSDDEEEKVKVIKGGPNVHMTPGFSIHLKPPGVPQKYDPSRDPQFMFGLALMKGYCTDDDGSRLMKINELKPWQALPPALYNKKRVEEAKKRLKEDKYTDTRNYYNPNNLNYNDRFH